MTGKELITYLTTIILLLSYQANALTPFWESGIALDNTGQILDKANIDIRITLIDETGTTLYTQTFTEVSTDQFAVFRINIDGTANQTAFAAIDAEAATRIKVETSIAQGSWNLSYVRTLYTLHQNTVIAPGAIPLVQHRIIMGDATNVGEEVAVGGEMTATNNGSGTALFIINNDAITNAKMADNSVGSAEIINASIVNDDISAMAAIAVTKLAAGSIGDVLYTSGGTPTWRSLNTLTWSSTGNSGTTAGTNFIGTTDDADLHIDIRNGGTVEQSLRMNTNQAIWRESTITGITPGNARGQYAVDLQISRNIASQVASGDYSTIGGGYGNIASASYSTVAGGQSNKAGGDYSTVAGGQSNTAGGDYSTVAGGYRNTANGQYSTVAGGYRNTANGDRSFIGSGQLNSASGNYSTVGGGIEHKASGFSSCVGGGSQNTASDDYSTVAGGRMNRATQYSSCVAGGQQNTASGNTSTIGGGWLNTASGQHSVIAGGARNTASEISSCVGGGFSNTAGGNHSTVSGGRMNTAGGERSTIGGGFSNTAGGNHSTISGGESNTASSIWSTVGGGRLNTAGGERSTISGGSGNTASSDWSTVGGGYKNTASGNTSTISGGSGNTTNGEASFVGGGSGNTAAGNYSTIGGGRDNTANGIYSTNGGGNRNTANGDYSAVGGGRENTASADFSTVSGGFFAVADKYGQNAYASGRFTNNGDAQTSVFVVRRVLSAGAAASYLYLNGITESMTVPNNTVWIFRALVVATISGAGTSGSWIITGMIQNSGGTVTISGVTSIPVSNPGGWTAPTAVVNGTALSIQATGVAGSASRWVARVEVAEVRFD